MYSWYNVIKIDFYPSGPPPQNPYPQPLWKKYHFRETFYKTPDAIFLKTVKVIKKQESVKET